MVDLDLLLERTSRTFALSIPPLPDDLRRQVTIAYLLFRIADTFEDAAAWTVEQRTAALDDFIRLLREGDRAEAERLARRWVAAKPATHAGYLQLLEAVPAVLADFLTLPRAAVDTIREHVIRSAEGMAGWVERTRDGELRLTGVDDLRAYCYTVAGIVGEMLTELFLIGARQLDPVASYLKARATLFGEGLQLVNILKDSAADRAEGRSYLPEGVDVAEVFALARADLVAASEYILALQRAHAPLGIIKFTAVPVQLAWASLAKIEKNGPGSKIGRTEVFLLIRQVEQAVDNGEPPVRIPGEHQRSVAGALSALLFGR